MPEHVRVAIVGAGFSGIAAALGMLEDGERDLALFERADAVGGVWRDNVYPGAACDVESHLYALRQAPNPGWTRRFSPQPEILAYLERTVEAGGLRDLVRFGHDVRELCWDEARARWRLDTSRGPVTADVVVAAQGVLAEPAVPALPGLDTFGGPTMHTARWDPSVALDGARVAVVGTGASAVQVVPALQPRVGHLTVFQRTAAWVMPRRDAPVEPSVRAQLAARPGLHGAVRAGLYAYHETYGLAFRHARVGAVAERVARAYLRRTVADPALRARLTPDFRIGCKRILLSDTYLPALTRPNVTVTGAAASVGPGAVVDADGRAHAADVLVLATGFRVLDSPFWARVVGRDGRRLSAVWDGSPSAHVGTTVAGFPNLFLLLGPNTGLGHSSVLLTMEAQVDHLRGALAAMRRGRLAAVEPRPEAQAAWDREVDALGARAAWSAGGCQSWYLDRTGRNGAVWPGSVGAFRRRVAPFDPADYRLRPADAPDTAAGDASGGAASAGADVRLTLAERALRLGALAVGRLPAVAQRALAGGRAVRVDGQTLDPATQAVLALDPSPDPAGLIRTAPALARARYRRQVALGAGRPTPVGAVRDVAVAGADGPLQSRLYAPDGLDRPPLTVYLHGGGFVEGDLETHDGWCRLLCRQAGHAVLAVAYRRAPEHPFPAAYDDALAAFAWAHAEADRLGADASRLAVAGDSAGGTLAAGVALAAGVRPVAQLLLYPATDAAGTYPSRTAFDGYFLRETTRRAYLDTYLQGGDAADPRVSPLRAGALAGAAPALVVTAGFDTLRDEGEAYARALGAAGVPVELYRQAALPHGFVHLVDVSRAARRASVAVARRWRLAVERHAAARREAG